MARNRVDNAKLQALDPTLRRLFRSLQERALPQSLRSLADQLDEIPRRARVTERA